MITDTELVKIAARHKLSVYFCGRAKRAKAPHIQILRGRAVLAEFTSLEDCAAWFPNPLPDAASKPIFYAAQP